MTNRGCLNCGRGFHELCKRCRKGKCHDNGATETVVTDRVNDSGHRIRRIRRVATGGLKDPHSTGRKRAAKLYPIDRDAPCEWRGYKNCGGGRFPIIGCYDGLQQHRHHGPIKNTLVNHEGNVHRICYACHVRWHELNDVNYSEDDNKLLPHMPTEATPDELVDNFMKWKTGEMGKTHVLKSSVEGINIRKLMTD